MQQITLGDLTPQLHPDSWAAPGSILAGAVCLGAGTSVWYAAVLRADGAPITIGTDSNVQDGSVVHADPDLPVKLGSRVSAGHRAVLHGCEIGDDVLIGMGAVVLNGARIGNGSLVAAGTVVLEGTDVPPCSMVAGVPGRVRRATTAQELAMIVANAQDYTRLARRHALGVSS